MHTYTDEVPECLQGKHAYTLNLVNVLILRWYGDNKMYDKFYIPAVEIIHQYQEWGMLSYIKLPHA